MHKLLELQLTRLKLDEATPPATAQSWADFLKRIENAYVEADQERYMLERSMDISSRELLELNSKLENAQHMAQLGYWLYDPSNKSLFLSKELRAILGLTLAQALPTPSELIQLIHEDCRDDIVKLLNSFSDEISEVGRELSLLHPDGTYHWYSFVCNQYSHPGTRLKTYTGIAMDITDRKKAEQEVAYLHQQLLLSAREIGMADISAAVLHNVGNVLNSVCVSLDLLKDSLINSRSDRLKNVSDLLEENMGSISRYLAEDEKGKQIPQYLISLSKNISDEYQTCQEEVKNLESYIQHIKEIVASQNSMCRTSGMTELIIPSETMDSALKISETSDFSNKINFIKNYAYKKKIRIDKTKMLQILVNILQNAKQSVLANDNVGKKEISISIEETEGKTEGMNDLKIVIQDNGVGIPPENLTRIFSFGYTTKEDGHGFGLHACAIAAHEMGGDLVAISEGVGKGATFVLTLPAKVS